MDTCRIELKGTGIQLVSLSPGLPYPPGLDPDEVPLEALIIKPARAVREMLGAIGRGRKHHLFPKRIGWLITRGRLRPEWLRRRIPRAGPGATTTARHRPVRSASPDELPDSAARSKSPAMIAVTRPISEPGEPAQTVASHAWLDGLGRVLPPAPRQFAMVRGACLRSGDGRRHTPDR